MTIRVPKFSGRPLCFRCHGPACVPPGDLTASFLYVLHVRSLGVANSKCPLPSILLGSRCVRCRSAMEHFSWVGSKVGRSSFSWCFMWRRKFEHDRGVSYFPRHELDTWCSFFLFDFVPNEVAQVVSCLWRSSQPARIPSPVFCPMHETSCERVVAIVELTTHEGPLHPILLRPEARARHSLLRGGRGLATVRRRLQRVRGTYNSRRTARPRRGGHEANDFPRGDGGTRQNGGEGKREEGGSSTRSQHRRRKPELTAW